MDPKKVLSYPLMGEKATILREKENKLTFIVNKEATKKDVQEAVEKLYQIKVLGVTSMVTPEGKKKAVITLPADVSAEEIASKFGMV